MTILRLMGDCFTYFSLFSGRFVVVIVVVVVVTVVIAAAAAEHGCCGFAVLVVCQISSFIVFFVFFSVESS